MSSRTLQILYEDENVVAVNKPHGLLVHRSSIDKFAREFALQILRNQIKQRVYPVHRLDRKTSGVLLFAKNQEWNVLLQSKFRNREVKKRYVAIVRGYIEPQGRIDYPLKHNDKLQDSLTHYKRRQVFEINQPFGAHNTSRYSLVDLEPMTGRFHQLRKHMAHIFHPIIGDRPHGCNKQNSLWKHTFDIDSMLLHADSISFVIEDRNYEISAPLSNEFTDALELLNSRNILTA